MKGFRLFLCALTLPFLVVFVLPIGALLEFRRFKGDEESQLRADAFGLRIKDTYAKFIRWE